MSDGMDLEGGYLASITSNFTDLKKIAKKKEKKKKKVEFKYLGRKRKPVFQKSDRQKLLDELIKKKVTNEDEVLAIMISNGIVANKDEANQMLELARMTSVTKRVTIPKNLITGSIICHFLSKDMNSRFINNDTLYWAYFGFKKLPTNAREYLRIRKVRVSSIEAFKVEKTTDIIEKYVNDFDVTISAPNLVRTKESLDTLKPKFIKSDQFYYMGQQYLVLSSKDKELKGQGIFTNETNDTTFKRTWKVIQDTEIMQKENDTLKNGVKTLTKNIGAYYFDKEFAITTFCPATVDLINESKFNVCLELEIDPDEYLNNAIKNENGPQAYDFMFEWENLEKLITIIEIYGLTVAIDEEEDLYKLVKYYNQNKGAFMAVKKHFKHFERIVLTYLDAFSVKINLDKLIKLLEDVNLYIADDEYLLASKVEIDTIRNLTANNNKFGLLNNYLKVLPRNAVDFMKHVLEQVTTTNINKESLEINIRSCAAALFDFLLTGKNPCIPTIRSPGIFLSNIIGDQSINTLQDNLEKFYSRVNLLRKTNEEIQAKVDDLVKSGQETARQKILVDISKYVANDQYDSLKKYLIERNVMPANTAATTVINGEQNVRPVINPNDLRRNVQGAQA